MKIEYTIFSFYFNSSLSKIIDVKPFTIRAGNAVEAVEAVRKSKGYLAGFKYTSKNQNDENPAVRDNAYWSDTQGYNGIAACRTGFEKEYRR